MINILDLTNRDKLWLPRAVFFAKELNLEKKTNLILPFLTIMTWLKKLNERLITKGN